MTDTRHVPCRDYAIGVDYCDSCGYVWPCDTIKALRSDAA